MRRARYPVYSERDAAFAQLRDARVLIYWPHGLGDWVHLGSIIQMLEPSNTYFITRFGDDYVASFDGNAYATPLFSGLAPISDGADTGAKHFGLDHRRVRGRPMDMRIPPAFDAAIAQAGIDAVLYTDYPERAGRSAFPYHTKARLLARMLVAPERLKTFDLSQPLTNTLDFRVAPETQRAVDERLRTLVESGDRLCVLATAGHTNARKNWAAHDVRAFTERFSASGKRWKYLILESDFGRLFGDVGIPFARAYRALLARTDLFVGVPAGPLHMAMARGDVPLVGIWLAHHPDWYDEPNARAVHLLGDDVYKADLHRREASVSKPGMLRHRIEPLGPAPSATQSIIAAARVVLQ